MDLRERLDLRTPTLELSDRTPVGAVDINTCFHSTTKRDDQLAVMRIVRESLDMHAALVELSGFVGELLDTGEVPEDAFDLHIRINAILALTLPE